MNLKLIDCHTHTNFSPDGKSSAEEMCQRAVELGLKAYAITDHCDCNLWYPANHYTDNISDLKGLDMYGQGELIQKSIQKVTELKEQFNGKLNLICGIELGQPLQDIKVAEKIVSSKDLDFIIGSHHQNMNTEDFYFLEYDKMDKSEIDLLIQSAFIQTYDMCKWGKFDVLGHLTYPLRYISGEFGIEVDINKYEDIIYEIFKTLINEGKGIEINTSGLRQKYGKTFPDMKYIKMYRDLGGEILSIGSDAHCTADLGSGIADGAAIALNAGFKYLCYFKERKPNFIAL